MWPNSYEGYWNSWRGPDRPRRLPKDIDIEAILAEARQMQAEETARAFRALGRTLAQQWRDLIAGPAVRYWRRRRLEAELSALSDQMLADIGVSRADIPRIAREAYRPRRDGAESEPMTIYEAAQSAAVAAVEKRAA